MSTKIARGMNETTERPRRSGLVPFFAVLPRRGAMRARIKGGLRRQRRFRKDRLAGPDIEDVLSEDLVDEETGEETEQDEPEAHADACDDEDDEAPAETERPGRQDALHQSIRHRWERWRTRQQELGGDDATDDSVTLHGSAGRRQADGQLAPGNETLALEAFARAVESTMAPTLVSAVAALDRDRREQVQVDAVILRQASSGAAADERAPAAGRDVVVPNDGLENRRRRDVVDRRAEDKAGDQVDAPRCIPVIEGGDVRRAPRNPSRSRPKTTKWASTTGPWYSIAQDEEVEVPRFSQDDMRP